MPSTNGGHSGDVRAARQELLDAAIAWTSRYRNVALDFPDSGPHAASLADRTIVMGGHQPTLFHPGVWLKNFVVDRLAGSTQGIGVNILIDHEPDELPGVRIPVLNPDGKAGWGEVLYDVPAAPVPAELRLLQDRTAFASFPDRMREAVRPWVPVPLVGRFWRQAARTVPLFDSTPLGLAAARHGLEGECGLTTLEVPFSRLCGTVSFVRLAAEVIRRARAFAGCYNGALADFRAAHGVRRAGHPVPDLAVREDAVELPFWIYSAAQPERRRLHVSGEGGSLRLFAPGHEGVWDGGAGDLEVALRELAAAGHRIRPRALMTTLFVRMMLADLFVHGIGGALYDRVTDLIARRFFGVRLPPFLTVTGTWRLVDERADLAAADLRAAGHRLRELDQHPERFTESMPAEARVLREEKRRLVEQMNRAEGKRERQRAIEQIHARLQPFLVPLREKAVADEVEARERAERAGILGSREISLVAHPEDLPDRLRLAADSLVNRAT